jgi:Rad3-related DNA helicase
MAERGASPRVESAACLRVDLERARANPQHLELLQLAVNVLPKSAERERQQLARTLSEAMTRALAAPVRPSLAREASASVLVAPDLRQRDPHATLETCFAEVAAWRQGFEARDGQVEMAHAVLDTLLSSRRLVVEAGTGTGKSLAYLLPAILVALLRDVRVVVSTHTRNLQQQLVVHDLPEVWECFSLKKARRADGTRRGLRYAKLLGRTNYVCRVALETWVESVAASGGSVEASRVLLALLHSPDGVLDEVVPGVDPQLVAPLRSRREVCVGRSCRSECPVYTAREAARAADVVVVNHALLLADGRSEGNVLGEYDALVVDEAHNLERVATETLGIRLGQAQADALVASSRRVERDLRGLPDLPGDLRRGFERFAADLAALRQELGRLLEGCDAALPLAPRVRRRQRYRDGDEVFGSVRDVYDTLQLQVEKSARSGAEWLAACRSTVTERPDLGELVELAGLLVELQHETGTALEFLARGDQEEWAFYLDFGAPGRQLLEIAAAPLDVALEIQRQLDVPERPVIYTSATLFTGSDTSYFRRGVGLDAATPVLHVPSPFDYAAQCSVVRTAALGHYRDPDFVAAVADVVATLHTRTQRRTLVLLTSHAALRQLHEELQERLGAGAPLLTQGVTGERDELARSLGSTHAGILLGTTSFWEGVDFPGETLEILVLAKLPFVVPDEPIVEARCERLRSHGEDPFHDFVLPEAVLRFRQGFGRLIRSRRDRGAVLLLDGRLETQAYGDSFVESLPTLARRFEDPHTLVEHVVEWFQRGG